MTDFPKHWLPPDWRGRRRIEDVGWHRLPEYDVGFAQVVERKPYGHEVRWFLYFRKFNERDVVAFPVLSSTVITANPGLTQTVTSDPTWNNTSNRIEVIGAGASGAHGASTATSGGGGGGGAYTRVVNATIATPGTTTYRARVGLGPTTEGVAGGDSWWDLGGGSPDIFPVSGTAAGARGGGPPFATGSPDVGSATGAFGGIGGSAGRAYASPSGSSITNSGGNGGNSGASNASGGGGGGAGGQNAAGQAGGAGPGPGGIGNRVGSPDVDGGSGGAAGSPGTAGGAGANITGTPGQTLGSGGGGGGANAGPGTGGQGGLYGGGGGGGGRSNGVGGAGRLGIVVLTWDPILFPGLLTDTDTIFAPKVDYNLSFYPRFSSAHPIYRTRERKLYEAAVTPLAPPGAATQNIAPGLVVDTETFFAPSVAIGGVIADMHWNPGTTVATVDFNLTLTTPLPIGSIVTLTGLPIGWNPANQSSGAPFNVIVLSSSSTGFTYTGVVNAPNGYTGSPAATWSLVSGVLGFAPPFFTDSDTFFAPVLTRASTQQFASYAGATPQVRARFVRPAYVAEVVFARTVIFSTTLNTDSPGWAGYTDRKAYPNLGRIAGNRVRVTIKSGVNFGIAAAHCSIGLLGAATAPNAQGPMLELTFNGGQHGFSIGANSSITSDWVPLSFVATDNFLFDIDLGGTSSTLQSFADVSGTIDYFKLGANDYQNATVSGYTAGASQDIFVSLIEGSTTADQQLLPTLFTDADAFFAPAVARDLRPGLVTDTDTFFAPTVSRDLAPALFTDSDTFFAPVVGREIRPPLVTDAETFFAPAVGREIRPGLFTDTETFFAPTLARDLAPGFFTDSDTFFAPLITRDISPPLLTDTETFYAPFVAAGLQLFPPLFNDSETFFSPLITLDVRPGLFTDSDTFFAPTISRNLAPGLFTDSETFFAPTVARGLAPGLFTDTDAFFAPTISRDIRPGLFTDSETFFAPVVSLGQQLFPPLITDVETFFAPTISLNLAPGLVTDADAFFSATFTQATTQKFAAFSEATPQFRAGRKLLSWGTSSPGSAQPTTLDRTLLPSLVVDNETFFGPFVSLGTQLFPSLFNDADAFFGPVITGGVRPTTTTHAEAAPLRRIDRFIPPMSVTVVVRTALAQDLQPGLLSDGDVFFAPAATQPGAPRAAYAYAEATPQRIVSRFIPPMSATVVIRTPLSQLLLPPLFTDTENFFSPTFVQPGVPQSLLPALFSDGDSFFAPVVTATADVRPGLFTDTDTFFAPAFGRQLLPGLFTDADSFFAPVLSQVLLPGLFTDSDAFFAPAVQATKNLQPGLFSDADTFFAPTVQSVADIRPGLFTDNDTFYTTVFVAPGATQSLLPPLFTDGDTFFAPAVTTTADIRPGLFSDADSIFAPALGRQLLPGLFTDSETLFTPVVQVGAANIAPALFTDADSFFAPAVTSVKNLAPGLFTDADTIFATVFGRQILPGLFNDSETFFAPLVQPGAVSIQPLLFNDAETFFSPVVVPQGGPQFLLPPRVVDADQFFPPTVAHADVTLFPALFIDSDIIVGPEFLGGDQIPSDPDRIYHVLAEDRTYVVPAEDRVHIVPFEDRVYVVTEQDTEHET